MVVKVSYLLLVIRCTPLLQFRVRRGKCMHTLDWLEFSFYKCIKNGVNIIKKLPLQFNSICDLIFFL